MPIFKCKMCGGNLQLEPGNTVTECEYCGTTQTIPSLDNEKKLNLFNRANNLRLRCEFDQAASVYQNLISEFPQEAEAYWGLCLCRYGIEYVDDPATGRKVPTCHRASSSSVKADPDYHSALECADFAAKRQYEAEAAELETLMGRILEVAAREIPYDIFLCYKETDELGRRTEDSMYAQDLYTSLVERGYRVFYARLTLQGVAGSDYESYIYAALRSAPVMLVLGTKPEYLEAVWVKNEWMRFLKMRGEDPKKTMIPCYKHMDAYDLPTEFQNLQALDMNVLTFHENLIKSIERVVRGRDGFAGGQRIKISDLQPYASNDEDHWENGEYLSEVDALAFKNIYLHCHIRRLTTPEEEVDIQFKVKDSRNVTIYSDSSTWKLPEGSKKRVRSHRWRIQRKDGTVLRPGLYTVQVQVGDSEIAECPVVIYHGQRVAPPAPQPMRPPVANIIQGINYIGGDHENDCFPRGSYNEPVNKDRKPCVFFHLSLNKMALAHLPMIHFRMIITNCTGDVIFDKNFENEWQPNYDKLSQGWILRGDDGTSVADGMYRATFIVENSEPRGIAFAVTSGKPRFW